MITTRVALHVGTDNLYFGQRALADLLGGESLTGLLAMAVRGRRASPIERETLDAISVAMCSADPRIWPLKLARLVASYGGTLAGYAAGQLSMEGPRMGPWPTGYAARELLELGQFLVDAAPDAIDARIDEFLRARPRIIGLGVPLRELDERHEALSKWAVLKGRDALPYWQLHMKLGARARALRNVGTNIVLGVAALLLDLDYTPIEASAITTFLNENVFAANALEAATQQAAEMQELPASRVTYTGAAMRKSPRNERG